MWWNCFTFTHFTDSCWPTSGQLSRQGSHLSQLFFGFCYEHLHPHTLTNNSCSEYCMYTAISTLTFPAQALLQTVSWATGQQLNFLDRKHYKQLTANSLYVWGDIKEEHQGEEIIGRKGKMDRNNIRALTICVWTWWWISLVQQQTSCFCSCCNKYAWKTSEYMQSTHLNSRQEEHSHMTDMQVALF